MNALPFEALRETQDRSSTRALLGRLGQGGPDTRDEIVWTLEVLQDPRSVEPLTRIVLDPEAEPAAREDASRILLSWGDTPDGQTLRRWWSQGDVRLQRHALRCMGRDCAEIVTAVAADPSHPHHLASIEALQLGFDEARYQPLKIAALQHKDAEVREAAARALLWDEPAAAEEPLLRALMDPVQDVAIEAADTLRYYPTRQVVTALAGLQNGPEALCEQARAALQDIADSVYGELERLQGPARERLLGWLAPLRPWLDRSEEEPAPSERPAPLPSLAPPREPLDALLPQVADLDGPWADKLARLRRLRPTDFAGAERERLKGALASHPDPEVRQVAARLLSGWGEAEALLAMLGDPTFAVRKTAMYALSQLPAADPRVAEVAWAHLHAPATAGTHAYETLETWLVHAEPAGVPARLSALLATEEREAVRYHAVHGATRFGLTSVIQGALPELLQPPRVTWGVHLALLEGARKGALPLPEGALQALSRVDHLHVQAEVARWLG